MFVIPGCRDAVDIQPDRGAKELILEKRFAFITETNFSLDHDCVGQKWSRWPSDL